MSIDVLKSFDPATASARMRTAIQAAKFGADVIKLRELVNTDHLAMRSHYAKHLISTETSMAQMADRLMQVSV